MKRNERGFAVYAEFVDLYGKRCTVLRSSIIGKPAVWIQNEIDLCGPDKEPLGNAHLDKRMARRVIKALQQFVDGKE
jgi:hypothetical protein